MKTAIVLALVSLIIIGVVLGSIASQQIGETDEIELGEMIACQEVGFAETRKLLCDFEGKYHRVSLKPVGEFPIRIGATYLVAGVVIGTESLEGRGSWTQIQVTRVRTKTK